MGSDIACPPRRSGKTTLLRQLFPEASFASLDLPSAAYQADERVEEFLRAYKEPVILDEVQYASGLFRYLKVAIDAERTQRGRFLMAGSQKLSLMHALSESRAGRCAVLELDTLASVEILSAFPEEAILAEEVLWRGGFPELWRDREMEPRLFFSSYTETPAAQARVAIPMDAIDAFCWNVRELALFGSVIREDFSPESDVDLLVAFEPGVERSLFDFVDMRNELMGLFGRKVDLVSQGIAQLEALRPPPAEHLTSPAVRTFVSWQAGSFGRQAMISGQRAGQRSIERVGLRTEPVRTSTELRICGPSFPGKRARRRPR